MIVSRYDICHSESHSLLRPQQEVCEKCPWILFWYQSGWCHNGGCLWKEGLQSGLTRSMCSTWRLLRHCGSLVFYYRIIERRTYRKSTAKTINENTCNIHVADVPVYASTVYAWWMIMRLRICLRVTTMGNSFLTHWSVSVTKLVIWFRRKLGSQWRVLRSIVIDFEAYACPGPWDFSIVGSRAYE